MELVPVVLKAPGFEFMTIPVMTGRVSIALLLETMSRQIQPFFEPDYGLPFMRDQIKADRGLRVAGRLVKEILERAPKDSNFLLKGFKMKGLVENAVVVRFLFETSMEFFSTEFAEVRRELDDDEKAAYRICEENRRVLGITESVLKTSLLDRTRRGFFVPRNLVTYLCEHVRQLYDMNIRVQCIDGHAVTILQVAGLNNAMILLQVLRTLAAVKKCEMTIRGFELTVDSFCDIRQVASYYCSDTVSVEEIMTALIADVAGALKVSPITCGQPKSSTATLQEMLSSDTPMRVEDVEWAMPIDFISKMTAIATDADLRDDAARAKRIKGSIGGYSQEWRKKGLRQPLVAYVVSLSTRTGGDLPALLRTVDALREQYGILPSLLPKTSCRIADPLQEEGLTSGRDLWPIATTAQPLRQIRAKMCEMRLRQHAGRDITLCDHESVLVIVTAKTAADVATTPPSSALHYMPRATIVLLMNGKGRILYYGASKDDDVPELDRILPAHHIGDTILQRGVTYFDLRRRVLQFIATASVIVGWNLTADLISLGILLPRLSTCELATHPIVRHTAREQAKQAAHLAGVGAASFDSILV
jgi:hypothetical protein